MNNWMDDFLSRCLEGVPSGKYRTRAEKELRDHLLSLSCDLEGTGYPPEEAHALAQARMGDPAELARRYAREWRQRSLGRQLLLTGNLFFLALAVFAVGMLYTFNTRNFGKSWVAYWGLTAILITQITLHSSWLSRGQTWAVTRWASLSFAVIQLPPIWCWMAYSGTLGFEVSGVMVPGGAGVLFHVGLLAWGLINYLVLADLLQKEAPFQQTA